MDATNKPVKQNSTQSLGNVPKLILLVGSTISLFLSSQLVAGFIVLMFAKVVGAQGADLSSWIQGSAFFQFLYILMADILILLGVWLFLRKNKHPFKSIGLAWPKFKDIGWALSGYIIYLLIFLIITFLAKEIFPTIDLDQKQQIGFEANQGLINLAIAGVSLVVMAPIVEEILCRGYLFTHLRKIYSFVISAIVTSAVFATAHLQFGSNAPLLWVAAIDTFVLSLVLVYLREKTGRLAAPMLLHAFKNLVAFCILFIFMK